MSTRQLCDVLRELRKSNNETQPMLAKTLGVSRSTISMYESGQREPDLKTLHAIADHYNVDMNYLTGLTNVSPGGEYGWSAPMQHWDRINSDRKLFIHSFLPYWNHPVEDLFSQWGISVDDPDSASNSSFRRFLTDTVTAVRFNLSDSEWEMVLNKKYRFTIHSGNEFAPGITDDFVTFPVLGDVAAGYGHMAVEDWTGDRIDVPASWLHGRHPEDYFVLRVSGDSMYPIYQDGDLVLVLRQDTMDHSGQIGVVIYDDDKATLKRVEYVMGEDWMKLSPINPQYPPITITDERLEHCRVLGMPKYLVREIENR
jgi:SOS-response transcriptional repressor LexA/transcriptional regulator with XRE-family HTH domain